MSIGSGTPSSTHWLIDIQLFLGNMSSIKYEDSPAEISMSSFPQASHTTPINLPIFPHYVYSFCMTNPHYNIVLATPGHSMKAEYVQSLVKTTCWMNSQGLKYTYLNKYSSFVPSARELTATNTFHHDWHTREVGSGEFTYDKIVWIDSDIEWEVEDFERLYLSDHDIISGLVQTDPRGTVAVNYPDENGRPTFVNKVEFLLHDEPVEVGGVGFGFVAMKSGVFENMSRPWFLIRRIQWEDVDFMTNVGEDYSWCANAVESGYKIWVDPLVKVKHHKETVYVV